MYQTNIDIAPVETIALMGKMVCENGKPDLKDRRDAIDIIRSNAIVREFVANLIVSRKRVAQILHETASDIS